MMTIIFVVCTIGYLEPCPIDLAPKAIRAAAEVPPTDQLRFKLPCKSLLNYECDKIGRPWEKGWLLFSKIGPTDPHCFERIKYPVP